MGPPYPVLVFLLSLTALAVARAVAVQPKTMGFHKSTLVGRGANTQLDPSLRHNQFAVQARSMLYDINI